MSEDHVEAILLWSAQGPSPAAERWLSDRGLAVTPMQAGLLVSGRREAFEAAFGLSLAGRDLPVSLPVPVPLGDDCCRDLNSSTTNLPPREIVEMHARMPLELESSRLLPDVLQGYVSVRSKGGKPLFQAGLGDITDGSAPYHGSRADIDAACKSLDSLGLTVLAVSRIGIAVAGKPAAFEALTGGKLVTFERLMHAESGPAALRDPSRRDRQEAARNPLHGRDKVHEDHRARRRADRAAPDAAGRVPGADPARSCPNFICACRTTWRWGSTPSLPTAPDGSARASPWPWSTAARPFTPSSSPTATMCSRPLPSFPAPTPARTRSGTAPASRPTSSLARRAQPSARSGPATMPAPWWVPSRASSRPRKALRRS